MFAVLNGATAAKLQSKKVNRLLCKCSCTTDHYTGLSRQ